MTHSELAALGFQEPRLFPTGETAAVQRFMFTVGVVTGIDEFGYRCRWCYDNYRMASLALSRWDGKGDPPGPWIKQKGRNDAGEFVDRSNPASEGTEHG